MKRTIFFLYFYICALGGFLISCENTTKYKNALIFSFQDFGEPIQLYSESIEFDQLIMKPRLLAINDSILFVQNLNTENLLYVYNIKQKKKNGEYLSFGSGPNELLRIKDMLLMDSLLIITDNQKRVVFEYNINDLSSPFRQTSIKESFASLLKYSDGFIATTMNPENKRFVFFDIDGSQTDTKGDFPDYGEDGSTIENMEAFVAGVVLSQTNNRIYLFSMRTDLVEIYSLEGILLKRMHGPELFYPQIKEVFSQGGYSRVSSLEGKARDAYFCPMIVNDEIYVSYAGSYFSRGKEPVINNIFVFDLDGNPKRRYVLPEPILMFTVDKLSKTIYATSDNPEYHLVKFETFK